jgi:hypothetical protein
VETHVFVFVEVVSLQRITMYEEEGRLTLFRAGIIRLSQQAIRCSTLAKSYVVEGEKKKEKKRTLDLLPGDSVRNEALTARL